MFIRPLLLATMMFITGCVHGGDRPYEIMQEAKESVYRLVSTDLRASGTGFVVRNAKNKKVIVSNAHVCNGRAVMRAIGSNGKKTLVRVLHESSKTDLCILQAPKRSIPLDLAERALHDERVYAVGYPLGSFMTVQDGRLKGYDRIQIPDGTPLRECVLPKHKMVAKKIPIQKRNGEKGYRIKRWCTILIGGFHTTIPVDSGFSGSPMLNDDAEIVGVIMAYKGNVSWAMAVDLHALKQYLGYKKKTD